MPDKTHVELPDPPATILASGDSETRRHELESLSAAGRECARSLLGMPNGAGSNHAAQRVGELDGKLKRALAAGIPPAGPVRLTADQRWIYDHLGRVRTALAEVRASKRALDGMAHARRNGGEAAPRIIFLAQDALAALERRFNEAAFSAFVNGFQSVTVLSQRELYGLPAALKLVLLERIAECLSQADKRATEFDSGKDAPGVGASAESCIRSLLAITEVSWRELLEPLTVFERVLREDPAGAYAGMDFDSRAMYRGAVTHMAEHSEHSELEIAEMALALARTAARGSAAESGPPANAFAFAGVQDYQLKA